ncbi:MAG TPA: dTMP kinase [Longimicrobiaceae bacterium]|nr:dTMP kinase [Longimicrobiaceae bacterium]
MHAHTAASAPPASGLFLAFEGVEGAGKTTQVRLLSEHLRARGFTVVVAREPGSTPLGERIREATLNDAALAIPARSELFLMLAARAAFVDQVVRPALTEGSVVIADRFELSTLAYQGWGRGLPLEEIRRCNALATDGLAPAATLLLDVEPEEGARRQRAAGKDPDRMESEEADFHRRVAAAYRALADQIPGVVRIDGRGSAPAVHARVLSALSRDFAETFPHGGFITSEQLDSPRGPDSPSSQVASEAE